MRNRFHSLCPYFAMFPESFAEEWIDRVSQPGDWVMDPFSGRGTTALTALLMGRSAVASDVNDAAYCLTRAKTSPPVLSTLRRRITQLEGQFDARKWAHSARTQSEFFGLAFDRRTLQQLLYLRDVLRWRDNGTDCMIAALTLGALHGDLGSSWYLSNQMPRTISTKPNYSVRFWRERGLTTPPKRDAFEILRHWAEFRYESERPTGASRCFQHDVRFLPRESELPRNVRCVITSPPYFDVTNFEEDQWLRIWFLGGPPRANRFRRSRDDRHRFEDRYWEFIADMWRSLGAVLPKHADVIIRIGSRRVRPDRLVKKLTASSRFSQRKVRSVSLSMSEIRRRQTDAFRPGSKGVAVEADCHYRFAD